MYIPVPDNRHVEVVLRKSQKEMLDIYVSQLARSAFGKIKIL